MRKLLVLVAAMLCFSTALFVPAARAEHCSGFIYVFSSNGPIVSEAVGCTVLSEGDNVDTRYIYPGSTSVFVRWFGDDFGPTVPTLDGVVDGLGADNVAIRLRRTNIGIGGEALFVYDSRSVPINRLAMGTLTASVTHPDFDDLGNPIMVTDTDTYRTVAP